VAPATPQGRGAISMVRLSGPEAFQIARKIFKPSGKITPRKALYGRFYDFLEKAFFDEGLGIFYREPHSYTGEDMVEFTPHGNPVIVWRLVELAVTAGARLARPGEFTYRAFINGKMDLIRAEAVEELVEAQSLEGVKLSFSQLQGSLSRKIEELRESLLSAAVLLETGMEFPDQGIEIEETRLKEALETALKKIKEMLALFETGKQLLEGITLVLVGKPNAGKSSIFNALLEEERAIVTEVPGTTRDFLREKLIVEGVAFIVIDTAGMNPEPRDEIEREGMRRAELLIEEADGVILVLDGTTPLEAADRKLIDMTRNKKRIVLLNKADLPLILDPGKVRELTGQPPLVVSATARRGLEKLRETLRDVFLKNISPQKLYVNSRQRASLQEAARYLKEALDLRDEELVAEQLRGAIAALDQLLGKITSGDVLNTIFSRFCIGK